MGCIYSKDIHAYFLEINFFPQILGTTSDYFPSCPVAGEYYGQLPDNPGLCAKLYSNCNKLDIMYYLLYRYVSSNANDLPNTSLTLHSYVQEAKYVLTI